MLSKKILLLGAIGATTASAGTMIGLYAHEVSQRSQRIQDKFLKAIYDNVNHIRSLSGMPELSDSVDQFSDDIKAHIAEKDSDLKTEVVEILSDTLTEAKVELTNSIDSNNDYHVDERNLLKKEVERVSNKLDAELKVIESGIVGEHDLNYYKKIIDNSVGQTQFQVLKDGVDTLDADIEKIQKELTQTSTLTTKLDTQLTDTISKLGTVSTDLTALATSVTALETATSNKFTNVTNMIHDIEENLDNKIDTNHASIKSDLSIIQNAIKTNNSTIRTLDKSVDELNIHIVDHDAAIIGLSSQISLLEASVVSIDASHSAGIKAVNDALAKLETDNQAFKDSMVKKTDANAAATDSLLISYNQLKAIVNTQEQQIQDLFIKYNNLDSSFNTKLNALEKYLVDEMTKQQADNTKKHNRLELLILSNKTTIDALNTKLDGLKGQINALTPRVTKLEAALVKYDKKIAEIEIDIADSIQKTDDLEIALRGEINAQEAKVLGLTARIEALENAQNSSAGAELLYQAKNSVTREGAIDMWNYPFFSPQPLENYRRLEMMGYSMLSGRYFALDFNLDTQPKSQNRIHDYAFGLRLHPNRTWLQYKVDYVTDKIVCSLAYAAGNASWTWNWVPHRYQILQIYGIKK